MGLGYLAAHLLEDDIRNVWEKVIQHLDPSLRGHAGTAFLLSGADVLDQYMPLYTALMGKDGKQLWRQALVDNFTLLKKSVGRERLVPKAKLAGADETDKALAVIMTAYAGGKPMEEVLANDSEMFVAMPLPSGTDKLKLVDVSVAALKKMLGGGDLDLATELALKLGWVGRLEAEQVYGMEDLAELVASNL